MTIVAMGGGRSRVQAAGRRWRMGKKWEEEVEMVAEEMAARRSGGGGGTRGTVAAAWGRRCRGDDGEVSVAGKKSGGGRRGGGDGGWTPSPAFLEQPLEKESTPFFLQMTARVLGGGVTSALIEPIMGREGKGPT